MIDKELIGKYVGAGLQHTVYEYGHERVIKIPHWWMRLSATLVQKQKELEIAKAHFGDYLPETVIRKFRGSYCYIQERVDTFPPLALSHIDTHKQDISAFLERNQRLVAGYRLSADLLGGKAYIHALSRHKHNQPILSANIVIEETTPPRLYLLDTDLLRTSPFHVTDPREIFFAFVSWLGYLLNRFMLRHYKLM